MQTDEPQNDPDVRKKKAKFKSLAREARTYRAVRRNAARVLRAGQKRKDRQGTRISDWMSGVRRR